jgi:hypothetical protein
MQLKQQVLIRRTVQVASLFTMTERGRAFSGREDSYSRLVGAGSSGAGYMGNEAARQRSKVYLKVKLHISLLCYVAALCSDFVKPKLFVRGQ